MSMMEAAEISKINSGNGISKVMSMKTVSFTNTNEYGNTVMNDNNALSSSESDVVVSKYQGPSMSTINTKSSIESSSCNSPYLISPPSSSFVSALQSPYISPRATFPPETPMPPQTQSAPPPQPSPPPLSVSVSCCSGSDDIPSTSYTPPTEETFEFSDEPTSADQKQVKYVNCETAPPRISFSFPVPRISLTKSSISPSCNAKLRSCDVYIGFNGQQSPNLLRFCKWLKSELEIQGIACFVADRAKYSDTQSHEIADRIICSATFGVVVVTNSSFLNHFSMEEIAFFTQKKNLIPLMFDTDSAEIADILAHNTDDKEVKEAIQGLLKSNEFKLEANDSNWRSCVSRAVGILKSKLGRKSVSTIETHDLEELPFLKNKLFVGRERELVEIENSFFGYGDSLDHDSSKTIVRGSDANSEGFADEESDIVRTKSGGRFISLEMRKCEEPTLEAWIEPVIGKSPSKRSKHKKGRSGNNKGINNVVCINGASGIGKTELALEFACRYSQRYKKVLWVGGETRYFRQNILNLSVNLGMDVSAEAEKERGRVRSFEEQEFEAFQRVKRELFRDVPYLVIIDNLETEKEWWEGKDLFDLIPRNTGASHVIITTRLPKVMNFDSLQLPPLPSCDAMVVLKGRRKEYPTEELEVLRRFDERLGRSSYGMWVVGSLLSELAIFPSVLFDAVNKICLKDDTSSPFMSLMDEQFCKNNHFLMKLMEFCSSVLEQTSNKRNVLASRMLLAGAWFAPAPISVGLLAAAAKNIPSTKNRFRKWTKCLRVAFCCCSSCCSSQTRKSEVESALLLVKLGLAKRTTRQPGCWIQLHPITQLFAKRKGGLLAAKATVQGVRRIGNPVVNSDHLWASTFLVFGFKSEPPSVQLKAIDMALFIKRTALPLAIHTFTTFSRCTSALELLKVCTNVLEDVEKSFVSQIQDWHHGSLCWRKKLQSNQRVDEYVWEDVTLLKATLLETRAKLLLRGGHFDSGEELCRTCISIRTVMLGHNHAQTLAAQETLTKLVRYRSKM